MIIKNNIYIKINNKMKKGKMSEKELAEYKLFRELRKSLRKLNDESSNKKEIVKISRKNK